MVKRILHTRMRVNDLPRAVAFYETALGLKVARRHTSPRGAQLVFMSVPNSAEEIELCLMPPGAPAVQVQPDLMHIAFEVDNIVQYADELEKKGIKLSDGPMSSPSGATIAFLDAPDGYEVELIQFNK